MAGPSQIHPEMPPQVAQHVVQHPFGAYHRKYRGRFRASVMVVLGIAALGAAQALYTSLTNADAKVALTLLACSAPFLGFAVWLGQWEYHNSGDEIYLFEGGVVHLNRSGTVHTYPWESIADVRKAEVTASVAHVPVRTARFFEARRHDGASVVLNNRFRGVAQLGERVVREATAIQFPPAVAAIRAGQAVQFDRVVLDAHGIGHRGRSVPWSAVAEISLVSGLVFNRFVIKSIRQRRPVVWRLFPATPYWNLRLLLALAETLIGAGPARTAAPARHR